MHLDKGGNSWSRSLPWCQTSTWCVELLFCLLVCGSL